MYVFREKNKTIAEANVISGGISYKEFFDHYDGEKIKKAEYYPYAYSKTGTRVFIEIINAFINFQGYNEFRVANPTAQICISANEITSIAENSMGNTAEVVIWTKAKGHLVLKIR